MSEQTKKILATGKYLQLVNDHSWEYVERVKGCKVVVLIPVYQGKLVLVEQYRQALKKQVIELPAGLVGDLPGNEKETLLAAAHRELEEETGFQAEKLTHLYDGPPSSGISNEVVSLFLAENLTRVGAGGGDESEQITVHEVPLGELDRWLSLRISKGNLVDPKIFTGAYFAIRTHLLERKS